MKYTTKEKLKIICDRIGMGLMYGCYLTILAAIIYSYGHPERIVTIGFNLFGEANFELLILLGTFPLILNVIINQYKKQREEWKQLNENPLRI